MTRKEKIIEKFLNMKRSVDDDYKRSSESEETKKIVEAIRTATNGTFVGKYCTSTLLGWVPHYDEQGRPLNADPNSKHSTITIDGTDYPISRQGWRAYVFKPTKHNADPNSKPSKVTVDGTNYLITNQGLETHLYNPTKHALLLAEVDLRPDYVKDYEAEMEAKRKKEHIYETRYDVVEFDEIINLLTIHYCDGVEGNTNVSILPKSFADGLEDD